MRGVQGPKQNHAKAAWLHPEQKTQARGSTPLHTWRNSHGDGNVWTQLIVTVCVRAPVNVLVEGMGMVVVVEGKQGLSLYKNTHVHVQKTNQNMHTHTHTHHTPHHTPHTHACAMANGMHLVNASAMDELWIHGKVCCSITLQGNPKVALEIGSNGMRPRRKLPARADEIRQGGWG